MFFVHNRSGESIEDFNAKNAGRRIGTRIKNIRESLNMTQAELGEKIGLNGNRIQQYETGSRKPKLDLIKQIAYALGVEPLALLDPVGTDPINLMYDLFQMEEYLDLNLSMIDDQIYISFGRNIYDMRTSTINKALIEWYKRQDERNKALANAETEDEQEKILYDYKMWEWTFPNALTINPPKQTRVAELENRISELQKELDELKKDDI